MMASAGPVLRSRPAVDDATARLWLGAVHRLYRVMHRREPDAGGLAAGLRSLRDGAALADLVRGAIVSDEFTVGSLEPPASPAAFDAMYQAVFGALPRIPTGNDHLSVADHAALVLLAAEMASPSPFHGLRDDEPSLLGRTRARLARLLGRRHCAVERLLAAVSQSSPPLPDQRILLATEPFSQDTRDLLLHFESLGDNCEFGLVQRAAGIEPLGLLRFATIYQPFEDKLACLASALNRGFEGLGAPGTISFDLFDTGAPREYFANDAVYSLRYHTGIYENTADAAELERREIRRLSFLRRKLLEDLANGEKIWVWKCIATTSPEQLTPLLIALRQFGRQNTLLWVVADDHPARAGTAERLGANLLKGYI